ncbi:hypothetical protein ACFSQ7_34670 [Paenibacillus rhizoplanae]
MNSWPSRNPITSWSSRGDSGVYLGLTEDCTPEQFRHEVQKAQETGIPLPLTDYINRYESRKGELFLIPPGTVHSAGKDNLVLEISSTTWWFTFKIYDFSAQGPGRQTTADQHRLRLRQY